MFEYDFQITAVANMQHVENLSTENGPSFTKPHLGFLIAPPKTGKSFIVIEMLNQSPVASFPRTLMCSNFVYSEFINVPRINTNIVVVSASNFDVWKDHIVKLADLKDQWLFLAKADNVQLLIDTGTLDTFSKNILIPFEVFRNCHLAHYHVSKLIFDTDVDWCNLSTVYSDFTWILATNLVKVKKLFQPPQNSKSNGNTLKGKLSKAKVANYIDYCVVVDDASVNKYESMFLPEISSEILTYKSQNPFRDVRFVEQNSLDAKLNSSLAQTISQYIYNCVTTTLEPKLLLVVFNIDKKQPIQQIPFWAQLENEHASYFHFLNHTQLTKHFSNVANQRPVQKSVVCTVNASSVSEADCDLCFVDNVLIIGGYPVDTLKQILGMCQRRPRVKALVLTRVIPEFANDPPLPQSWSIEFEEEWAQPSTPVRNVAVKRFLNPTAEEDEEDEEVWKSEI